MYDEEYKKETKIIEKSKEEKEIELLVNIYKTKKELEDAIHNFEYAEGDLIDYYTYQIKATRAKYDYLLKKAKKVHRHFSLKADSSASASRLPASL